MANLMLKECLRSVFFGQNVEQHQIKTQQKKSAARRSQPQQHALKHGPKSFQEILKACQLACPNRGLNSALWRDKPAMKPTVRRF